jgi:hypothetical protein
MKGHTLEWLRECGIEETRHTMRIEIAEWAILGFVFVSDTEDALLKVATIIFGGDGVGREEFRW